MRYLTCVDCDHYFPTLLLWEHRCAACSTLRYEKALTHGFRGKPLPRSKALDLQRRRARELLYRAQNETLAAQLPRPEPKPPESPPPQPPAPDLALVDFWTRDLRPSQRPHPMRLAPTLSPAKGTSYRACRYCYQLAHFLNDRCPGNERRTSGPPPEIPPDLWTDSDGRPRCVAPKNTKRLFCQEWSDSDLDAPHFIYGILRASDRLLLYVGSTRDTLPRRLEQHRASVHVRGTNTTTLSKWLAQDTSRVDDLIIIRLDPITYRGKEDALDAEYAWIRALKTAGVALLNRKTRATTREGTFL